MMKSDTYHASNYHENYTKIFTLRRLKIFTKVIEKFFVCEKECTVIDHK